MRPSLWCKTLYKGRYTRGSLLPQHAPATRSRSKAPSSAPTISSEKSMLRNKTFAPEFCSLITNWFDMREQAPGASSGSKSVARFCFRSKLPRVYWLVGTYRDRNVFQEQAPSCLPAFTLLRELDWDLIACSIQQAFLSYYTPLPPPPPCCFRVHWLAWLVYFELFEMTVCLHFL